jgi:hypothetical protein
MSDFDELGFQSHAPAAPAAAAVDHFDSLGFEPHENSPEPMKPIREMNNSELKENQHRFSEQDLQKEMIRRHGEAEDAKGNAFLDTLTLWHLPQIKAKIGQLVAGEGISNNDAYVKRRDAEIAQLKSEGEKFRSVPRLQELARPLLQFFSAVARPHLRKLPKLFHF